MPPMVSQAAALFRGPHCHLAGTRLQRARHQQNVSPVQSLSPVLPGCLSPCCYAVQAFVYAGKKIKINKLYIYIHIYISRKGSRQNLGISSAVFISRQLKASLL